MNKIEQIERKIIGRLMRAILDAGHCISVNDGEEWVLKMSTSQTKIMGAMFSTDEDFWRVRNTAGESLGVIHFVHGNGNDVISDYSCSLEELIAPVQAYSDTL